MFGPIKGLQNVECGQIGECAALYNATAVQCIIANMLQHTALQFIKPKCVLLYIAWNQSAKLIGVCASLEHLSAVTVTVSCSLLYTSVTVYIP